MSSTSTNVHTPPLLIEALEYGNEKGMRIYEAPVVVKTSGADWGAILEAEISICKDRIFYAEFVRDNQRCGMMLFDKSGNPILYAANISLGIDHVEASLGATLHVFELLGVDDQFAELDGLARANHGYYGIGIEI